MSQGNGGFVSATKTSFEVLEAVRELDGAGVSELARHLDRSKSGVHKHVKTLATDGYLVQRGMTYHVGVGLWALGTSVRDRFPTEEGESAVDSLAASVDLTVSLVLYEAGTAAIAYVNTPPDAEPIGRSVGDTLPLHATAAGKAILAYADDDERASVLAGDALPAFTNETITDPETLRDELAAVRQRRTAVDREEYDDGVECVAAPIVKTPGDPVGAVTVSGTIPDLDGTPVEESVQGLVVSASRSVENAMDAPNRTSRS